MAWKRSKLQLVAPEGTEQRHDEVANGAYEALGKIHGRWWL
jgi:hypothetical protein